MSKAVPTGICLALAGFISVSAVFGQTSPQPVDTSTAAADLQAAADSNSLSKKSPSIKRPRIGLALGGGGSRGAGHVGVLKVLKEENIPIDIIAGTSIGSVVGGFYAAGKPIDEIGQIFVKNTFTKEFTPMPALRIATEPAELMLRLFGYKPYDGLYRGWKFRGFVNKALTKLNIEQLGIPYAAVVTDVVTGKSCRLTTGDIALAMQASTAVPGLKKPVQIGDKLYCDGGLINNVPVNHVREMGADFVIAIDIDEKLKDTPLDHFRGLGSMARQALKIQLAAFDSANDDRADMYIHPDTTGINLVSFKKGDGKAGIDAGIAAARAAMPELKKKLAALGIETVAQK
jgi:NTE family protein